SRRRTSRPSSGCAESSATRPTASPRPSTPASSCSKAYIGALAEDFWPRRAVSHRVLTDFHERETAMRVLVTGYRGFIGAVMVPLLQKAGHDVTGLDTNLFEGCAFSPQLAEVKSIKRDLRDVTPADVEGFDAVVHLAALSNDP